jgi:methionine synthase II (cobalamin-independent)
MNLELNQMGWVVSSWILAWALIMINEAIAHRPDEMTIAMHLCRGNNQGEWLFSGGYDAVAEERNFSDSARILWLLGDTLAARRS